MRPGKQLTGKERSASNAQDLQRDRCRIRRQGADRVTAAGMADRGLARAGKFSTSHTPSGRSLLPSASGVHHGRDECPRIWSEEEMLTQILSAPRCCCHVSKFQAPDCLHYNACSECTRTRHFKRKNHFFWEGPSPPETLLPVVGVPIFTFHPAPQPSLLDAPFPQNSSQIYA